MHYLLDSLTAIRHFSNSKKLGSSAKTILEAAATHQSTLCISVMSLLEIWGVIEKNNIPITYEEWMSHLEGSSIYQILPVLTPIIHRSVSLPSMNDHERILAATALWLEIPLITNNEIYLQCEGLKLVWE